MRQNAAAPKLRNKGGSPAPKTMLGAPFEKRARVCLGMVGLGVRGMAHIRDFLDMPEVDIVAICDIDSGAAEKARQLIASSGKSEPAVYAKYKNSWEKLCRRGDLDLVYISTPWGLHVPNAVAAMEGGSHVALEVPAAMDIRGCWRLVRASEKIHKHCMMMENCNYGRTEMMVLNMAKSGLFGTITHGEAAYIHDLRESFFADEIDPWRRPMHTRLDGNLYPTHGLGPICRYLGIHRGDRLLSIASFSSREAALSEYAGSSLGKGDPKKKEEYVCGDMNTSIIKTALGRTILLQYDVVTPRPYSRRNLIQGTKGCFADYPPRVYITDTHRRRRWSQDMAHWESKYGSPLWKELEPRWQGMEGQVKQSGHIGMNYIMNYRLIQCMLQGEAPDFDVYDAAAWSAPFPLSVSSVKRSGEPQKFPDFTNGLWRAAR